MIKRCAAHSHGHSRFEFLSSGDFEIATFSTKMFFAAGKEIFIYYMGSSASGQDGAILPARDCRFCSGNNISPKFRRVHESFLSQNIFRDSKKIFCDFFVGMELENENTETRYHFCI